MTRRELIVTATTALPASIVPSLDTPWLRVIITTGDGRFQRIDHTWYGDAIPSEWIASGLCDGDRYVVESSEHSPLEYTHSGPSGPATYLRAHQCILGPEHWTEHDGSMEGWQYDAGF